MATAFAALLYLSGVFYIVAGVVMWGWQATLGGFLLAALGGLFEMLREIKTALAVRKADH